MSPPRDLRMPVLAQPTWFPVSRNLCQRQKSILTLLSAIEVYSLLFAHYIQQLILQDDIHYSCNFNYCNNCLNNYYPSAIIPIPFLFNSSKEKFRREHCGFCCLVGYGVTTSGQGGSEFETESNCFSFISPQQKLLLKIRFCWELCRYTLFFLSSNYISRKFSKWET